MSSGDKILLPKFLDADSHRLLRYKGDECLLSIVEPISDSPLGAARRVNVFELASLKAEYFDLKAEFGG